MSASSLLAAVDTDIPHNDSMQDVRQCLQDMRDAIDALGVKPMPMNIIKVVAYYKSAADRDRDFNMYIASPRNTAVVAQYDEDIWRSEKAHYGVVADATFYATQTNTFIMAATKQNYTVTSSWENGAKLARMTETELEEAREKHLARDIMWHEFVVVLDKRKVYIFDPSYDGSEQRGKGTRQVKNLPMVGTRAHDIIQALLSKGKSIEKIFYGGGGNVSGTCRRDSLGFIKGWASSFIDDKLAPDIEWEQVRR